MIYHHVGWQELQCLPSSLVDQERDIPGADYRNREYSPTMMRFAFSRRRTARIHAAILESGSCGPTKSALIVVPHRKR